MTDDTPKVITNLPPIFHYVLYSLGVTIITIMFIELDFVTKFFFLLPLGLVALIFSGYELNAHWTRVYGELQITKSSIITVILGYVLLAVGCMKLGTILALLLHGIVNIPDIIIGGIIMILAAYSITRVYKDADKTLITHIVEDMHEQKTTNT